MTNLEMKIIVNYIYLLIIAPNLLYLGYLIYSDQKINENVGLIIMFLAFMMLCEHIYIIFYKYKINNKLLTN